MIYISYFAKYHGNNGVAICKYLPGWDLGYPISWYPLLAPTAEILNKWKASKQDREAEKEYIEAYERDVLSKLDVHQAAKDLDGCVLLCYENDAKFCHRFIVRGWLIENGYDCEIYEGWEADA